MEPEKKSNGTLIGLVVIVIILIIGGIYMWQTKTNTTDTTGELQVQTEAVNEQDSADLENLDKDLESVDTEIDASVINSVQ